MSDQNRLIFNPPPGWPKPPQGWTAPNGWTPDPSWPKPPPGWELWITAGDSAEVSTANEARGSTDAARPAVRASGPADRRQAAEQRIALLEAENAALREQLERAG